MAPTTTKSKSKLPARTADVLPAVKSERLEVKLVATKYLALARTFRDQAQALKVTDAESHETALTLVKTAKGERREAIAIWKIPKSKLQTLTNIVRDLEKQEVGAYDDGIAVADTVIGVYVQAEQRRQHEASEKQRLANEAQARKDREADLERQEAEAARLEAESPTLSTRELWFVNQILDHGKTPAQAAKSAEYKNPAETAERLMASPKIVAAIAAKKAIIEIREQAAATREAPLEVQAPKVESKLGYVPGTSMRTYYSAAVVDLVKFRAAYRGLPEHDDLPEQAMVPNMPFLNQQATALKEKFEPAYPGCRLVVDTKVAG